MRCGVVARQRAWLSSLRNVALEFGKSVKLLTICRCEVQPEFARKGKVGASVMTVLGSEAVQVSMAARLFTGSLLVLTAAALKAPGPSMGRRDLLSSAAAAATGLTAAPRYASASDGKKEPIDYAAKSSFFGLAAPPILGTWSCMQSRVRIGSSRCARDPLLPAVYRR